MGDFLDDMLATVNTIKQQAPTPATAPPAPSQIDPFSMQSTVRTDAATAVDRSRKADTLLAGVIAAAPQRQAEDEARLAASVDAKHKINESIAGETQNLATNIEPVLQRRVAIANRVAEVQQMNPFKRALVSTFSLTHNPEWLAKQDQAAVGQLQAYGTQYQQMMGLHDNVLKVINSNYEGESQLSQLHQADQNENVALAVQSAGSAEHLLGSEISGLQAQTDVLKAQEMTRQDILGKMTHAELNNANSLAKKNGGVAVINGVPLHTSELTQMANQWQEQEMSLQSRALALQSQHLGLADQLESKAIGQMSGPRIAAALANGGKLPDGTQLDQGKLTQAYASSRARQAMIAEDAGKAGSAGTFVAGAQMIQDRIQRGQSVAQQLFGNTPAELNESNLGVAAKMKGVSAAIRQAGAMGADQTFLATQIPVLQDVLDGIKKNNLNLVTKWAGGDKDLVEFGSAMMDGSPINPGTSARAYVKMIRKGIPAGTRFTGPAGDALKAAQAAVQNYGANAKAGSSVDNFLKGKTKPDDIPDDLIQAVQAAVTSKYVPGRLQDASNAAPMIARQIVGADGKPHPFSQTSAQELATATQLGDEEGYKRAGQLIGVSGDVVKTMFSQGPNGAEYAKQANTLKNKGWDYNSLGQKVQALQTQGLLTYLDQGPSAKPGYRPSQAYVDLLNNSKYQSTILNGQQALASASPGDALSHSIGGTEFERQFWQKGQMLAQAQATLNANDLARKASDSERLRDTNPVESANLALHMLPNLSESDANKLLNAVKTAAFDKSESDKMPLSSAIDSVITTSKFQDPELERIRQAAAKNWVQHRANTQSGLARYHRSTYNFPDPMNGIQINADEF